MSYRTAKTSAFLSNVSFTISQKVQDTLRSINKTHPPELLLKYGARQGMLGDIPVLAFPMLGGSFHCVTYSTYPKEPRFLTAPSEKDKPADLGLLGADIFLQQADQGTVFITEGLWDMLTLVQYGYPAVGLPGVNNLLDSFLEFFKDKKVYLLYDNDLPGKKSSALHYNRLKSVASSVRILSLPEQIEYLGEKVKIKDISDLFLVSGEFAKEFLDELISKNPSIQETIKDVIFKILASKGNVNQKIKDVASLIVAHIEDSGGNLVPFNERQEMAIVLDGKKILTEEKVDIFLAQTYGYMVSQSVWIQIKETLYNYSLDKGNIEVENYSVMRGDRFYIGTKENGLLVITPTSVEFQDQGYDGVFLKSGNDLSLTFNDAERTREAPIDTIDGIFDMFDFSKTPLEQKFLLKVWFYFSFFSPGMRSSLFVTGPQGCGKTLLLKLLKGVLFSFAKGIYNPNIIPEEDYVFSLVCKESKYMFCDEMNEGDPKTKSRIRTLVTGHEDILRPKYAKKFIRFRPQVWLVLASNSPRVRDPDIAQRLLIIELEKLRERKLINETLFFERMEQIRPFLWRGIVTELQRIMNNLIGNREEEIPLKKYCRQVEMAQFAYQAFPEQRELCLKTFSNLHSTQQDFSLDGDPTFDVISQWWEEQSPQYTNGDGRCEIEPRQLFNDLSRLAKDRGVKSFPMSAPGLGKWLGNREEKLKEYFGFVREEKRPSSNWFVYRFNLPEKESF